MAFVITVVIFRLLWTAEEAVAMVFDSIDDCIPQWPCCLADTDVYNLYLFEYVPVALRFEVTLLDAFQTPRPMQFSFKSQMRLFTVVCFQPARLGVTLQRFCSGFHV